MKMKKLLISILIIFIVINCSSQFYFPLQKKINELTRIDSVKLMLDSNTSYEYGNYLPYANISVSDQSAVQLKINFGKYEAITIGGTYQFHYNDNTAQYAYNNTTISYHNYFYTIDIGYFKHIIDNLSIGSEISAGQKIQYSSLNGINTNINSTYIFGLGTYVSYHIPKKCLSIFTGYNSIRGSHIGIGVHSLYKMK